MTTDTHFSSHLAHFFSEREMFQTKFVEKIKTDILCSVAFSVRRAVYEIMWNNTAERGRPQVIWSMRTACWITKATNTHSEYVILIAFPQQQWLQERASMLPYMYIACLVSGNRTQKCNC